MEKMGGLEMPELDLGFYKGKKVLVTGHTGFKGTWLCKILVMAGANVIGYSLDPPSVPSLYELSCISNSIKSIRGDVRDFEHLKQVFIEEKPEVVFHLAAQPIVRDSYKDPRYTYETNVMGTVNLLECVRQTSSVKSVLNVTTDKVYQNQEWCWGYRENEPLDGFDPYSNSKSCSELVTHAYVNSFWSDYSVSVSTARAGNVIGGGDFANDRIIPDCVRAIESNKEIIIRNPNSTRPYQHVLEPLNAYLIIAQKQYVESGYCGNYNVGPDDCDCITTGELVDLFCRKWGSDAKWTVQMETNAPHEANFLKLDCSKMKQIFNWHPVWHLDECMDMIVRFHKNLLKGQSVEKEMEYEIHRFFA